MKKNTTILACFWISLALLTINAVTVYAQVVEIPITGGGFRINGPRNLGFPAQPFSFNPQNSVINFKDTTGTAQYLEVTDENGGSSFNVAIASDDLTPDGLGICNPDNCIPNTNLSIKNNDDISNPIDTIEGSASTVSLDPSTNSPASLDQQRTLLNGNGSAPGTWRIYPQLRETTPGNTAIATYLGVITITIMPT